MHTYVHIHIQIHLHTQCPHTHAHTCTYACTYTCIHTLEHTCTHTCAHTLLSYITCYLLPLLTVPPFFPASTITLIFSAFFVFLDLAIYLESIHEQGQLTSSYCWRVRIPFLCDLTLPVAPSGRMVPHQPLHDPWWDAYNWNHLVIIEGAVV